MAIDNARTLALIRKLDRVLSKGHGSAALSAERVHLIRTTARRLQALVDTLDDHPNRKQRKLLKRLKQVRRAAGGVRDFDVQIAALRKLKIGREQQRKARLVQFLLERRGERERKLAKALGHKDVQKIRKALHRWSAELTGTTARNRKSDKPIGGTTRFDGVSAALRQFSALSRQEGALTPDTLHAYRTRCKRIRYVAEIAGNTPAAKCVLEPLKRIQDATGDWHDWLTLAQTAESLFERALDSALLSALRNVTNAKFVEARLACQDARRSLLAQHRMAVEQKQVQKQAEQVRKSKRSRARQARKPPLPPPAEAAAQQAPPQTVPTESDNKPALASVAMAASSVA